MKMISRLMAIVLPGFLLITSCHKKDTPANPALSVDKIIITQAATAGTETVAVSSNVNWKATSSASWATVSTATGSNNGNVTVTMTANNGAAVRTADLTIAPAESGSSLTEQVIKITQGGSAPFVMVDKTAADIAGTGGTQDIKVTSNTDWTLNIPATATWITADKASGVAGQTTVHYTVVANTTSAVLSADVTYTATEITTPVKTTFTTGVDYKITSFSPASASIGSAININGIFAPDAVVKINGVIATNIVVAADGKSITCKVPTGANGGKVTVEFGGNTYSSTTDMLIYGITSVAPNTLPADQQATPIVITGKFDASRPPSVTINGTSARVTAYTTTSITITLPAGATDGKINVIIGNNTYTSTNDFVVTNRWAQVSTSHGVYYDPNSVGFVLNNQFYTGLGTNNNGNLNNDFKIFDPSIAGSNKWTAGPVIPTGGISLRRFASCFVLNNKAYIGFGTGTSGNVSDWWSFDPSGNSGGNGTWNPLTPYPTAGFGGLAFVVNNVAYTGAPVFTNDISAFDPTTNGGLGSWGPSTSIPSNLRSFGSSFFVIGSEAYIIGSGKTCYRFTPPLTSPATPGTVTQIADFPFGIQNCPAFSLNGRGYVIAPNTRQTYMFDPASNTWSDTHAFLPAVIFGTNNAQVINGVAYAFTPDGIAFKFIP